MGPASSATPPSRSRTSGGRRSRPSSTSTGTNTAEQSQFWEVEPLRLGQSWTEHVNESHLIQNAYLRVTHLLVVRDVPECWRLAANAEQPRWETIATPIEMLPCP
jgi:hypothetical protein